MLGGILTLLGLQASSCRKHLARPQPCLGSLKIRCQEGQAKNPPFRGAGIHSCRTSSQAPAAHQEALPAVLPGPQPGPFWALFAGCLAGWF